MAYNTKRDGYYTRPTNPNPLGSPVARLEPSAGHTHAVIIPGTSYKMFCSEAFMNAKVGKISKAEWFMKALAKTTVSGNGKRRAKAAPVLLTIEEFHVLNTEVKAA